jgi:hypothetical protein
MILRWNKKRTFIEELPLSGITHYELKYRACGIFPSSDFWFMFKSYGDFYFINIFWNSITILTMYKHEFLKSNSTVKA